MYAHKQMLLKYINCTWKMSNILTPICVLSHNVVALDVVFVVFGSIVKISTSGSFIKAVIKL